MLRGEFIPRSDMKGVTRKTRGACVVPEIAVWEVGLAEPAVSSGGKSKDPGSTRET